MHIGRGEGLGLGNLMTARIGLQVNRKGLRTTYKMECDMHVHSRAYLTEWRGKGRECPLGKRRAEQ